jgi:hypothetical protein
MNNTKIKEEVLEKLEKQLNSHWRPLKYTFIQEAIDLTLKEAQADELEFLENEVWHLEHQPEEIKITIKNIKERIKQLEK